MRAKWLWVLLGLLVLAVAALWLWMWAWARPARPDPAVGEEASAGLVFFAQRLPDRAISELGFESRLELSESALGAPLRVHRILPDRILGYGPDSHWMELIEPTPEWLYPLVSADAVKTLLSVGSLGGEPAAVKVGSGELGRWLARVRARWPAATGHRLTYVRIQMADVVAVESPWRDGVVPLATAARLVGLPEAPDHDYDLYRTEDLIPQIMEAVRETL